MRHSLELQSKKLRDFYNGKKVFVTGHTGFKGSWLCATLLELGADITGYALEPKEQDLFSLIDLERKIKSIYGDIRDYKKLNKAIEKSQSEIVFHLAAQPLVRESYNNPSYTYDVNVMGTVNILEAVRMNTTVKSFLNITTDKVYENREIDRGYTEEDRLDGYDPYSNSKSCSELITSSYIRSFFDKKVLEGRAVAISTARAGNVIGGGDFAKDRIIPDCVRTALGLTENKKIVVRNPNAIRPYQHVLEPIVAYLQIAQKQYEDITFAGAYNIGPNEEDCLTTEALVNLFCQKWGERLDWENEEQLNEPHEAGILRLNTTKAKESIGWKPRWNIEATIEKTVEWTKCYSAGQDVNMCMVNQIKERLFIYEEKKYI